MIHTKKWQEKFWLDIFPYIEIYVGTRLFLVFNEAIFSKNGIKIAMVSTVIPHSEYHGVVKSEPGGDHL